MLRWSCPNIPTFTMRSSPHPTHEVDGNEVAMNFLATILPTGLIEFTILLASGLVLVSGELAPRERRERDEYANNFAAATLLARFPYPYLPIYVM